MRNYWLVARHEYAKIARKRTFLLSALGFPLLLTVVIAISMVLAIGADDNRPLGYVDMSGLLSDDVTVPLTAENEEMVPIQSFPDEPSARQALEQGAIQAYYIVPSDYPDGQQRIALFYQEEEPGGSVRRDFADFLRANLLQTYPEAVQQRLLNGSELTVRSADGSRQSSSSNLINLFLPFVAGFFFFFTVLASSGYLLQVVADEKENRTVEIMITTISPEELIGGKALGLLAVALTTVLIWLAAIVVGLLIAAQFVELVRQIEVPWAFLGILGLFFLPAYMLIAGFMTAVGAIATETQQAQQIAGTLNLLFVLPFFFTVLVFTNPDSPVLVFFTLFPTTSFLTVALRWSFTAIPFWQLAGGWLLTVVTAVLAIWGASRIFRAGMLRYGQRLSLQEVAAAVGLGRK
jgi:ABC-2 type transport system permease protein